LVVVLLLLLLLLRLLLLPAATAAVGCLLFGLGLGSFIFCQWQFSPL